MDQAEKAQRQFLLSIDAQFATRDDEGQLTCRNGSRSSTLATCVHRLHLDNGEQHPSRRMMRMGEIDRSCGASERAKVVKNVPPVCCWPMDVQSEIRIMHQIAATKIARRRGFRSQAQRAVEDL